MTLAWSMHASQTRESIPKRSVTLKGNDFLGLKPDRYLSLGLVLLGLTLESAPRLWLWASLKLSLRGPGLYTPTPLEGAIFYLGIGVCITGLVIHARRLGHHPVWGVLGLVPWIGPLAGLLALTPRAKRGTYSGPGLILLGSALVGYLLTQYAPFYWRWEIFYLGMALCAVGAAIYVGTPANYGTRKETVAEWAAPTRQLGRKGFIKGLVGKIDTGADAVRMVRGASVVFYVLAGMEALSAFLFTIENLFDAGVYALLALLLQNLNSRVVAVTLLVISLLVGIADAGINSFAESEGGPNIIRALYYLVIALISFLASIRAVEATFKIHRTYLAETRATASDLATNGAPVVPASRRLSFAVRSFVTVLCFFLTVPIVLIGAMHVYDYSMKREVTNALPEKFPVVVVTADGVRVVLGGNLNRFISEHPDYSYLVPRDKVWTYRAELQRKSRLWEANFDVSWLADGRQSFKVLAREEAEVMNEGWYEATDREVFPKYHKSYVVWLLPVRLFPFAFMINGLIWGVGMIVLKRLHRRKAMPAGAGI